jgi:S-DNA-T family DNA segregation ATPase FtsK/SpoIIIE
MAKPKPARTGPSLGQEVIALAILGTGILLLLALFSFDPRDLAFYAEPAQDPKANLVGPAGAYLGGILFLLFGLGSYLFPVVFIAGGLLLFFAKEVRYSQKFLYLGILLVTGACLLQLAAPAVGPSLANPLFSGGQGLDGAPSPAGKMPGGYIGYFLNDKFLAPILGTVGAVLVFGLSYLVVLVLLFEFRPAELARAFGEAGRAIVDQYWDYRIRKAAPDQRIELEQKKLEIEQKRLHRRLAREKAEAAKKAAEPAPAISRPSPKIVDTTINPLPSALPGAASPKAKATPAKPEKIEKPEKPETKIKDLGKPVSPLASLATETPPASTTTKPAAPKPPTPAAVRPSYTAYKLPSVDLLQKSEKETRPTYTEDELKTNQQRIVEALAHFDIEVSPGDITRGSTITRYELYPAPGVRVERIVNLERDLARTMKAERINILAPVPGRDTVAIEVANSSKIKVLLRDLLESGEWSGSRAHLPVSLGKDVYGATLVDDLADLPHVLIAGTTGSGKSVCINTLLLSLLYRFGPDDLRLILIDPKVVELQVYNRLPHLVVPVVTEPKKVLLALKWTINEMEKRYRYMAKAGVRNIGTYNSRSRAPKSVEEFDLAPRLEGEEPPPPSAEEPLPDRLPFIVVIIDELANLMQVAPAEVENAIALLSAKARAAGIHLVIATQTPRAAVITGVIKTNVPARIAFQVPSGVDSRVILDESGAENLLGKGDLLYLRPGASKLIRAQGAFVSEEEVSRVIDFIAAQAKPYYEQEIHAKMTKPSMGDSELSEKDEELMARSLEVIKTEKRASTSLLQRRLGLGYGRAAWVIDQFESRGIIGPRDGAKDREILVDLDTVQL